MTQYLPYLFFLSCPLSMGVMMWFMMRGTGGAQEHKHPPADARLLELEREVQALRARQRDHTREPLDLIS